MDISEFIGIFFELLMSCFSYCYSLLSDIKVFNGISLFSICLGSVIFPAIISILFSIARTSKPSSKSHEVVKEFNPKKDAYKGDK